MAAKLTPWFMAAFIKPVRVGVYQRNTPKGDVRYSYWDGATWGSSCDNKWDAHDYGYVPSVVQDWPWRGLASDPKAA